MATTTWTGDYSWSYINAAPTYWNEPIWTSSTPTITASGYGLAYYPETSVTTCTTAYPTTSLTYSMIPTYITWTDMSNINNINKSLSNVLADEMEKAIEKAYSTMLDDPIPTKEPEPIFDAAPTADMITAMKTMKPEILEKWKAAILEAESDIKNDKFMQEYEADFSSMEFKIEKVVINTKSRSVKGDWVIEDAESLKTYHSKIDAELIEIIRRNSSNMIAYDICNVQPMNVAAAQLFDTPQKKEEKIDYMALVYESVGAKR